MPAIHSLRDCGPQRPPRCHAETVSMSPPDGLPTLLARPVAYTRVDLVSRFGRREVEAAIARGEIVRLGRDAYVGARHAQSQWAAASAMVSAIGAEAAVTGRAALFLWGMVIDAPSVITVASPAQTHPRVSFPGVRLLRTRHVPPRCDVRGMPIAEPEWAIFHAVREVSRSEAIGVALEAMSNDAAAASALPDLLKASPRAPRRRVLREALAAYDHGVRSALEFRGLREVLTGPEFAAVRWQVPLAVAGRRFVIDAFHRPSSVAFEFDGARFHLAPERWRLDRERDTLLASIGVQTVRFPYRDVVDRPDWCRRMACEVVAQRGSQGSLMAS